MMPLIVLINESKGSGSSKSMAEVSMVELAFVPYIEE